MKAYLISGLAGLLLAIAGWFWHEYDVSVRSANAVKAAKAEWDLAAKNAVLVANKATRDKETANFRTTEINEANRAAERDRLVRAESAVARSDRGLRNAIASAINRQSVAENAADGIRPPGDCAEPLKLFGEAADEASRMATEAGRLAIQVTGLQKYGQACFELTNSE